MLKLATLAVGALAFDFTAFDSLAGTPPVRRSDAPRSNPPAQRAGSSQSYRQQCELDKGDPAVPSDAQSSVWFVQARGACHDWCMDERGEKCASACDTTRADACGCAEQPWRAANCARVWGTRQCQCAACAAGDAACNARNDAARAERDLMAALLADDGGALRSPAEIAASVKDDEPLAAPGGGLSK